MPRYRLTEAHFLGDKYVEGGAIVDWNGPPSRHMVPEDDEAKSVKDEYDVDRPHLRRSRDLLPKAAVLHDPMTRQPGMPRVAGPPQQIPPRSSDPNNPVRAKEIAEAQIKADAAEARRPGRPPKAETVRARREAEEADARNTERQRAKVDAHTVKAGAPDETPRRG